jgi:hypothetical protein
VSARLLYDKRADYRAHIADELRRMANSTGKPVDRDKLAALVDEIMETGWSLIEALDLSRHEALDLVRALIRYQLEPPDTDKLQEWYDASMSMCKAHFGGEGAARRGLLQLGKITGSDPKLRTLHGLIANPKRPFLGWCPQIMRIVLSREPQLRREYEDRMSGKAGGFHRSAVPDNDSDEPPSAA